MFMLILRPLRLSLLIIFSAMTALYLMIYMVPGDLVNVLIGPRAAPELRQELIERLGLD
jgi:peptide/nickel transport system permease protein